MPPTTFYEHGPFSDLCKGPHVASTGKIGPFKLLARRRRVLARRREAADAPAHLRHGLGRRRRSSTSTSGGARRRRSATTAGSASQLDLFSFHDVSPGSAFWHPKGQRIWRDARGAPCASSRTRAATRRSRTPILVHKKLWEQSGHWATTRDNMFLVEVEDQTLQPQADELPRVDVHLPRRSCAPTATCRSGYSEYGRLHRNERSGTLSGLTRVRQFIQDDAHIYVRPDQLADEIEALLGEVREAYGWFGLDAALRVRDAARQGARRPGRSGSAPRRSSRTRSTGPASTYVVKPKDGTFYAPKIDIYIDDALGREWQMATIQVDLDDAARAVRPDVRRRGRPAAAAGRDPPRDLRLARALHRHPHRALRGRVPALAGAGPGGRDPDRRPPRRCRPTSWPRVLRARGLRVEVDASDNRMQNKIRLAQGQKVPYMLVLGDREVEARTASVRRRGATKDEPQETLAWDELGDRLGTENRERRPCSRETAPGGSRADPVRGPSGVLISCRVGAGSESCQLARDRQSLTDRRPRRICQSKVLQLAIEHGRVAAAEIGLQRRLVLGLIGPDPPAPRRLRSVWYDTPVGLMSSGHPLSSILRRAPVRISTLGESDVGHVARSIRAARRAAVKVNARARQPERVWPDRDEEHASQPDPVQGDRHRSWSGRQPADDLGDDAADAQRGGRCQPAAVMREERRGDQAGAPTAHRTARPMGAWPAGATRDTPSR